MKKKKDLVSIVLNCYNGGEYLKEALISVQNQSYQNWELIFWDNCSKDNSKEILESFKNKKFKYFLSKKHTSLYAARNLAISKTRGKFVGFIDSDDIWENDKLKKQIKLFDEKNVAVVYGNSWIRREKTKQKKIFIREKIKEGYIYNDLLKSYNVGILTALIKRSFLKGKKIFDDKYNIIGDFDLFIKLSKEYKFKVIQDPVATYRIHEKNLSILQKKLEIKEFDNWYKKNRKKLSLENRKIMKNKINQLKFVSQKFNNGFLKVLIFFITNKIFSIKNLIILFTPKLILKKIMWFY
tara:strand:+ start:4549 stop:5436 length:888 start_codon:yes stop_codon:yes gene_type:complete